jgi:hypothetical protein
MSHSSLSDECSSQSAGRSDIDDLEHGTCSSATTRPGVRDCALSRLALGLTQIASRDETSCLKTFAVPGRELLICQNARLAESPKSLKLVDDGDR